MPVQDKGLRDALVAAVTEAMPELSALSVDKIVTAVTRALDALGLLDDLAPDFPEDA